MPEVRKVRKAAAGLARFEGRKVRKAIRLPDGRIRVILDGARDVAGPVVVFDSAAAYEAAIERVFVK